MRRNAGGSAIDRIASAGPRIALRTCRPLSLFCLAWGLVCAMTPDVASSQDNPSDESVPVENESGRGSPRTSADSDVIARWVAGWVEETIRVDPDSLRQRLERGWILPETFVASHERVLLVRGVDYLLDPRRGTVRLIRELPEAAEVDVRYRSFPIDVTGEYRLHRPYLPPDSSSTESGTLIDDAVQVSQGPSWQRALEQDTRLQIAGSKTFAVEVGSQQDLSLKQSLDLSVQGRIGRDVNVRAVLTDRDTPLQPEGTSTQLSDLDRVLVEVEGPVARMRLGDYPFALPPTEFARYQRQLEGVQGEVYPGAANVFATGANAPGSFGSVEFLGEEGKQGPYSLAGQSNSAAAIVPGSEKVFIEDRRVTRGEDADYIVDYADGTITFTGRIAITAYTRITVDFQFDTDSFRKSVYGAGMTLGEAGLVEGVSKEAGHALRATWLLERDDKGDPLSLPLSDAQREELERIGDAPGSGSGIEYVGPGNGEYDAVSVDTLAAPFYVYTGPDSGAYFVRFELVGESLGDYVDTTTVLGDPYFVFVGEGVGTYLPGRSLVAPQSHSVLSLGSVSRPVEGIALRAEAAYSDFDANTLSPIDDGDNQGLALLLEGRAEAIALGSTNLELGARFRQIDPDFRTFERLDNTFFAIDWNLDESRLSSGDRRYGLEGALGFGPGRVGVQLERLDNTKDFSANRVIAELELRRGPFSFTGRALETRSEDTETGLAIAGARSNERATGVWSGRWLSAQGAFSRELNRTGQGVDRVGGFYRQGSVRIGTGTKFETLTLGWEFIRRNTYRFEGAQENLVDVGDTGTFETTWHHGGGRYVSGSFTRRDLRPKDGREARRSDLGQVRWLERTNNGLFLQEGRWELSTTEERKRVETIEFVGESEGHYDSLGVYQGIGDYEVFVRELPEPILLNRIDSSFRTEFDLGRQARPGNAASFWRKLWGSLRLVNYWTSRIEADEPASYLFPRMIPVLLGLEDMPLVDVSLRTDVSALAGARWASPRVRLENRKLSQGSEGELRESNDRRLVALRLRSRPLPRWSADIETEWDRESRTVEDPNGVSSSGSTGWNSVRAKADNQLSMGRGVSLGIEAAFRRRERIESLETANVWEGTPSVVWSPKPRSRVELRTTRTSVDRRNGSGRPDRTLERSGWTSRLVSSVRLGAMVDLSFWLRETRPDDGRTIRDSRLELRATF